MTFSVIAIFAVLMMKTAARPLLGSVPTVASRADAEELVATQAEHAARYEHDAAQLIRHDSA